MKQSRIAVTGGIGSGKSEIMKILSDFGFTTVSADEIAKSVNKMPAVVRKIKKAFGAEFAENGVVNSRMLAEFVFKDEARVKKLESITHPQILREMRRQIKAAGKSVVFAEVPLLVETGSQKRFGQAWLVTSPLEIRFDRLKQRGMSRQQIQRVMDKQFSDEIKSHFVHKIIVNDGSLGNLKEQVVCALGEAGLSGKCQSAEGK